MPRDTVNIDGWNATRKSLDMPLHFDCHCLLLSPRLYQNRDRAKKKYKDIFIQVTSKLWDCFHAENKLFMSRFKGRDDVYERRWEKRVRLFTFLLYEWRLGRLRQNEGSCACVGICRFLEHADPVRYPHQREVIGYDRTVNIVTIPVILRCSEACRS